MMLNRSTEENELQIRNTKEFKLRNSILHCLLFYCSPHTPRRLLPRFSTDAAVYPLSARMLTRFAVGIHSAPD